MGPTLVKTLCANKLCLFERYNKLKVATFTIKFSTKYMPLGRIWQQSQNEILCMCFSNKTFALIIKYLKFSNNVSTHYRAYSNLIIIL